MNKCIEQLYGLWQRLSENAIGSPGKTADEGGCGVVGFASTVPVAGRHIFEPSVQMHNRGNGKGGGIAAVGLNPDQLGVDAQLLKDCYILQVALLDSSVADELERAFITPKFDIAHRRDVKAVMDWRELKLDVQPPDIVQYFVRVKQTELQKFTESNRLTGMTARAVEDEYVYQNSFQLNQKYYAAQGDKQAFVMSHARDLVIFKIVGYAEQVVQYYGLDDFQAHAWIAHQRYPTKGRVWHPAGAHPFIGMNEALVHNGDLANYYSISQYLRQHKIVPQFLTDTEVAVLLFDLLSRTHHYPLEYIIEVLAPTAELDFDRLPDQKKRIYRDLQAIHMHGSPDGPWLFIVARSEPDKDLVQLLGITDTSMLRPQVFALQEGDVSIGLVASEKQAIDATLQSLAKEDNRFRPIADRYWMARGGSHTDGGAFIFSVDRKAAEAVMTVTDKFGRTISIENDVKGVECDGYPDSLIRSQDEMQQEMMAEDARSFFDKNIFSIVTLNEEQLAAFLASILVVPLDKAPAFDWVMTLLGLLNDRPLSGLTIKRSVFLEQVRRAVTNLLDRLPGMKKDRVGAARRLDAATCQDIRAPQCGEVVLVIDSSDFEPEGNQGHATLLVRAYELGWRRFVIYGLKGHRFTGCGLGTDTNDVRIDVWGSSGDYLGSGMDGLELHVHDSAQDQLGQILKSGTLVIHGDVGQAFMYGAKGGDVYVRGNAAGRALINAVGRPRVVINGTCLDFLAESFMAGDPLNGGGFVVLNGLRFNRQGKAVPQETPYPGSNLFSLASGGAIYVRDPKGQLVEEQLNSSEFAAVTEQDWALIYPYLQTNEELFGISIEEDLLTVDGKKRDPSNVYRKIRPRQHTILSKE